MAPSTVQIIESTIPEGMTIDEWRRARPRPPKSRRARVFAAFNRVLGA